MPYLGKTPSQATRQRYYLTASGGETSISGTMTTGGTLTFNDGEFVDVKLNGVSLVAGTDYNTTTANTIGGLSALAANDQVEIVVYDTFSVFSGDVDSDLSVGGNLSVTGTSALTGAATITTDDNNPQLTLTTTDADAGTGPTLDLFRDSASPADADVGGKISFTGKNDAGETLGMAIFQASHVDVSDGTEDAKLAISSRSAGSMVSRLNLDATETVFNEDSVDLDFRVESNGNANMLFVDGGNDKVGIGTGSGSGQVTIQGDGSTRQLVITDDDAERLQLYLSGNNATIEVSSSGSNDTNLIFKTSATGTESERMRLTNDGGLLINKTSANTGTAGFEFLSSNNKLAVGASGGASLFVNRNSSDGIVVQIAHEGAVEGNISTSGTTVSFNGGHLSRWSRLADDSKDTSILKGTVMTNLDKMVVWHHEAEAATLYEDGDDLMITPDIFYKEGDTLPDGKEVGDLKTAAVYAKVGDEKTPAVEAYDEDNEQLNCMAVSSVEGDINVAGVFVNWDEDDDYNDMNVAMTGDMVIRIAKDTTVARGDLLMSAGDGTAKPQGDDIVRSKTIAKVTSTVKSHTYDDGSYLVPCVLMAC